jgi:hypothetical protein
MMMIRKSLSFCFLWLLTSLFLLISSFCVPTGVAYPQSINFCQTLKSACFRSGHCSGHCKPNLSLSLRRATLCQTFQPAVALYVRSMERYLNYCKTVLRKKLRKISRFNRYGTNYGPSRLFLSLLSRAFLVNYCSYCRGLVAWFFRTDQWCVSCRLMCYCEWMWPELSAELL